MVISYYTSKIQFVVYLLIISKIRHEFTKDTTARQHLIPRTVFQKPFNNATSCLSSTSPLVKRICKKSSWKQSFPISIYTMATGIVIVKSKSASQKNWPEVGNGLYSSRYCSPCSICVKKGSTITTINTCYSFHNHNCKAIYSYFRNCSEQTN